MKVLLLGANGVMGRRYAAILKYLGREVIPIDIDRPEGGIPTDWDHAIVATPTPTHSEVITEVACAVADVREKRHMLVEKPVMIGNAMNVGGLFLASALCGLNLYCVNQYAHLPEAAQFRHRDGTTTWNYWNSGRDGLKWDCFQLFALANAEVNLANDSPVWRCSINGVSINPRHMDMAYVAMVSDFLGAKQNVFTKDIVVKATERILAYQ